MFQKLIYQLFARRHYWRQVSFDEVAELYASRLIAVFAANIVNMFAAVYLYNLGYSIEFIALLYACLYLGRACVAPLVAKYVAYVGPKHGSLTANILRIPSLAAFACVSLVGHYAFWAVLAFGILQQIAAAFDNFSYNVNFSKVKHSEHAGKEIGTMQIIEKLAKILSPIIGGAIATIYGAQVVIILACLLFAIAAVPLFHTVEPIKLRNKLKFSGFPWQLAFSSLVSETVVGVDFVTSGLVWTLFVTLFVFGSLGDSVYAALGSLASLGVLVSMLAAWTFGQMVDRHKGGVLLTAGTIVNSIIHLFRPYVTSGAGVIGVNIANETATSAYALPFTRVLFDVADNSGARLTYFMMTEIALALGAASICAVLALAVIVLGVKEGMTAVFILVALYELVMLISRRAAR